MTSVTVRQVNTLVAEEPVLMKQWFSIQCFTLGISTLAITSSDTHKVGETLKTRVAK